MQRYDSNAIRDDLTIDPKYQTPAPGVQFWVKDLNGTVVQVYETNDINGPVKPNPDTTGADGNFFFYAPNGRYRIEFATGDTRPDELLFDPNDEPIRYSLIDNPLMHLFKKNNQEEISSSPLSTLRSTTGTVTDIYNITKTIGVNTLREGVYGWLTEGESTNACLYSEDLTNAAWVSLDGAIVTPNSAISPDGNLTADNVNISSQPLSRVSQQISASGGESYTFSLYVNSAVGRVFSLSIDSVGGTFISNSNTIITNGTWQRISVSIPLNADNTGLFASVGGGPSDQSDFNVWGAQIEKMKGSSSYIPTSAAPVTRSADDVTSGLTYNIPNISKDFSICFNVLLLMPTSDSDIERLFNVNNDELFIQVSNGLVAAGNSITSATAPISTQLADIAVISFNGVTTVYVNGSPGTSSSVNYNLQSSGTLYFFQSFTKLLNANCNVNDFRIYDFALNGSELAFLKGF